MTESWFSGQKAQCPSERDPRLALPDHRVGWSSRDLESLGQDVSTNILCAHILGSNLVAWERCKKETWKISPAMGRCEVGVTEVGAMNKQRIWPPYKVVLP